MANLKNQLKQLSSFTEIVADTGEIEQIKMYKPKDSTTNPSLLFKAAQLKEYASLLKNAINYAKNKSDRKKIQIEIAMDKLAVNFGVEILKIIPGLVSTEIDSRLSFNSNESINKVYKLIEMYKEVGVDPKKKVLFKIASTWEGLKAMKTLQKEQINCNMTLLFNIWQAATAAEFGAFLISPFVGRITDWYVKKNGWLELPTIKLDPGIQSVRNIYSYYKAYNYKTIVMGASFRSKLQILALAGADKLTVAPKFLKELEESTETIKRNLSSEDINKLEKLNISEENFRFGLNNDPCAVEKLSEGIRSFCKDTEELEKILINQLK